MIRRTIDIKGWMVDVFIDDGGRFDMDEVLDVLYSMGADTDTLESAFDKLKGKKPNEAFTYSNGKRSCIYIGWTTDGREFTNSVVHEVRHLIDHIASARGVATDGEEVGYMSGDAAYLLAEDICRLGCSECRGKEAAC